MYIINVLVLTVLFLISSTEEYIVPMCLENGDVCADRIALSLPGFSFYTQFCLKSPDVDDSVVSHMFCTFCDLLGHFNDMISSSVTCILGNERPQQPETYFEIMVEYLGLDYLVEKKKKQSCMEELILEHYMTAIYSLLFIVSIATYCTCLFQRQRKVEPTEQLTFLNKFEGGGDSEENFKSDRSSVNDHQDSI